VAHNDHGHGDCGHDHPQTRLRAPDAVHMRLRDLGMRTARAHAAMTGARDRELIAAHLPFTETHGKAGHYDPARAQFSHRARPTTATAPTASVPAHAMDADQSKSRSRWLSVTRGALRRFAHVAVAMPDAHQPSPASPEVRRSEHLAVPRQPQPSIDITAQEA
jgi:hypothetical protein